MDGSMDCKELRSELLPPISRGSKNEWFAVIHEIKAWQGFRTKFAIYDECDF
jgi:hypothetical protein